MYTSLSYLLSLSLPKSFSLSFILFVFCSAIFFSFFKVIRVLFISLSLASFCLSFSLCFHFLLIFSLNLFFLLSRSDNQKQTYSNFLIFLHCVSYLYAIKVSQVSISPTFYARFFCQYPFAKKLRNQNVTREKLLKALLYMKNVSVKRWWNWHRI